MIGIAYLWILGLSFASFLFVKTFHAPWLTYWLPSRLNKAIPVSRFECVSGLSVYPVEIRSVNNLSSSEDCSTDYCQPVWKRLCLWLRQRRKNSDSDIELWGHGRALPLRTRAFRERWLANTHSNRKHTQTVTPVHHRHCQSLNVSPKMIIHYLRNIIISPTCGVKTVVNYLQICIWCKIDSVVPEYVLLGTSQTFLFRYFRTLFLLAAFLPFTTTNPLSWSAAMLMSVLK